MMTLKQRMREVGYKNNSDLARSMRALDSWPDGDGRASSTVASRLGELSRGDVSWWTQGAGRVFIPALAEALMMDVDELLREIEGSSARSSRHHFIGCEALRPFDPQAEPWPEWMPDVFSNTSTIRDTARVIVWPMVKGDLQHMLMCWLSAHLGRVKTQELVRWSHLDLTGSPHHVVYYHGKRPFQQAQLPSSVQTLVLLGPTLGAPHHDFFFDLFMQSRTKYLYEVPAIDGAELYPAMVRWFAGRVARDGGFDQAFAMTKLSEMVHFELVRTRQEIFEWLCLLEELGPKGMDAPERVASALLTLRKRHHTTANEVGVCQWFGDQPLQRARQMMRATLYPSPELMLPQSDFQAGLAKLQVASPLPANDEILQMFDDDLEGLRAMFAQAALDLFEGFRRLGFVKKQEDTNKRNRLDEENPQFTLAPGYMWALLRDVLLDDEQDVESLADLCLFESGAKDVAARLMQGFRQGALPSFDGIRDPVVHGVFIDVCLVQSAKALADGFALESSYMQRLLSEHKKHLFVDALDTPSQDGAPAMCTAQLIYAPLDEGEEYDGDVNQNLSGLADSRPPVDRIGSRALLSWALHQRDQACPLGEAFCPWCGQWTAPRVDHLRASFDANLSVEEDLWFECAVVLIEKYGYTTTSKPTPFEVMYATVKMVSGQPLPFDTRWSYARGLDTGIVELICKRLGVDVEVFYQRLWSLIVMHEGLHGLERWPGMDDRDVFTLCWIVDFSYRVLWDDYIEGGLDVSGMGEYIHLYRPGPDVDLEEELEGWGARECYFLLAVIHEMLGKDGVGFQEESIHRCEPLVLRLWRDDPELVVQILRMLRDDLRAHDVSLLYVLYANAPAAYAEQISFDDIVRQHVELMWPALRQAVAERVVGWQRIYRVLFELHR